MTPALPWLLATALVYISSRSVYTSAGTFIWVPLTGLWRMDIGVALLLLFSALFAIGAHVVSTRVRWMIASCIAALHIAMAFELVALPFYYIRPPRWLHPRAEVTIWKGALPPAALTNLTQAVWQHKGLWTKISMSKPLPYAVLGSTSNFDRAIDPPTAFWTLNYGFRHWLLPHTVESAHVLLPQGEPHRRSMNQAIDQMRPWLSPLLRASIARVLKTTPDQILLGGDDGFEGGTYPAIQVWLPNLLWASVINPHTDSTITQAPRLMVTGLGCNESTTRSFLWPISAPTGTGLIVWAADGEFEVNYKPGTIISFPANLFHAIRPWPYAEWSLPRITMQAFAQRCGERWVVYH